MLAIVLRPLALVALLIVAMYASRALEPLIPDGRVKRALYAAHEVVPDPATVSPTTRRVCTAITLLVAALVIFKPFRYLVP